MRVSFIHRVFDHRKKHHMVTTLALCVPFDRPRAPISEPEMWKMVAQDLGRFGVLDYWMFKPEAEVLVTGSCFTGEREKGSEFVRLMVGPPEKRYVDKKLYVFGDRKWTLIGASEPDMFSRMPIDYAHAFGGKDYAQNPIGKGLVPVTGPTGAEFHPLPNVEDPRAVMKSKGDKPPPASFAPWDLTWPHHFTKKMGSYTSDWVEKNGFALADDVDFSLFNVAAPDQRAPQFFPADEQFRVENMHPERRVLDGKLPGFKGRCLVRFAKKYDAEQTFRDVPMRIDTIHLFPHRERAIIFFRGVIDVHTMDGSDVELVVAAVEDEERKSIEHYATVVERRLDKEKGALYSLRDRDLMPASAEVSNAKGISVDDPLEKAAEREDLARQNFARRAQREYEKAREQALAQGVDPEAIPPPPPPPAPVAIPDLENIADFVEAEKERTDKQRAEAEAAQRDVMERLGALAKEFDIDLEKLQAEAKKDQAGPPKFSAAAEIERLEDMLQLSENAGAPVPGLKEKLDDPNFRAQLLETQAQLYRAYRITAHQQLPAGAMNDAESATARAELVEQLAGAPRTRRDFTGANLAGIDLRGMDLEGAFFEGANLKGANLEGANLKDAVLARANLEGANLTKADLSRANLGAAKLLGANLSDAVLVGAILYETDVSGCKLCRVNLNEANAFNLRADGADFTGVKAERLVLVKGSFRGASFKASRIFQSIFMECDVSGIDCAGSDFSETVFLQSTGEGARFTNARIESLRIVESSFEKSDFSNAHMPGSNLRGAKLAGSNFAGVNLRRSDLSTADMTGVDFERGIAVECLMLDTVLEDAKMMGANLMLSIMHRAILRGADVSKANLFCADLTGAVGDNRTSFSGSNVKRALVAGVFSG